MSPRSSRSDAFTARARFTRSFAAMGTTWWLQADVADALMGAESLVRTLEAQLSRFGADSALTELNRRRSVRCATVAEVTRLALNLKSRTHGAFDPTLGGAMQAIGYSHSFPWQTPVADVVVAPAVGHLEVRVEGDRVTLDGAGELDLGGIAKGYAVDRVLQQLREAGASHVLVDGGGDLRGLGGPFPIGVGEGLVASTGDGAIATSSTCKRRWEHVSGRVSHHLVDPLSGASVESTLDTATVIAPTALLADVLATAVIVRPAHMLSRLPRFGAHALVRDLQGQWWTTPGAPVTGKPTRRGDSASHTQEQAP